MKFDFEVTYQDGRKVTASARPKDFVAFERQYGKSIAAFGKEAPIEWVYYLAWSPLHRLRQELGDFDGFLDIVDDVTPVDAAADAVDPTQPAPSPEPSS